MNIFKRFIIFCIVGGSGALIELLFFNLFYLFTIFSISKFIGLVFALTFNFIINRTFTFSASNGKKRGQIMRYLLVYSIALSLNYLTSLFINNLLGGGVISANVAAIAGILVSIPITFFGSNYFIFKS